jgi:hypothetical protein
MKRFIFIIVILLASISSYSQVKIGLQFSPSISSNRIETQSETYQAKQDASKLKFKFGVIADLPIGDTYYFSTGAIYTTKHVGIQYAGENASEVLIEEYDIQYLQIPLTVKLFTNEITLDTKLFFNLGVNAEIAISEKIDKDNEVIEDFGFFDTALVLGAGVERKVGTNTAVFMAVSYNRGLINPIHESVSVDQKIILKNDMLSLDLGIKF